MKLTKKYRELWGTESKVSIIFSIILTIIFSSTLTIDILNDMLRTLFSLTIPAYIGIIGFLFSGLALMSTIITHKALKVINEKGHINAIVGILYSFYYCGALIIGEISFDGIFYLFSFYQLETKFCSIFIWIYWGLVFFILYLTVYSLLYTTSLLGSCIKFFFVNVYYENFDKLNHK
ncbi:hypothetical protein [Megasphaera cerevisiae]|nr:hypothetical protein [Megasphaera cerevisiae]